MFGEKAVQMLYWWKFPLTENTEFETEGGGQVMWKLVPGRAQVHCCVFTASGESVVGNIRAVKYNSVVITIDGDVWWRSAIWLTQKVHLVSIIHCLISSRTVQRKPTDFCSICKTEAIKFIILYSS